MGVFIDRQTLRQHPAPQPAMRQTWYQLLFLHWPLDPASLAGHLPPDLEVDTFDGKAWIGVVPFGMRRIRHPLLPPLPGLSATLELNVRTYVHHRGIPGVWFFSLDASHPLVVWGARRFFHLPYVRADMSLARRERRVHYRSRRRHRGAPPASLDATWEVGAALPEAGEGSLEFFLTERYCLYTAHRGRLIRGRIHHPSWNLRAAKLVALDSSMLACHRIVADEGPPLLHHADELTVEIWPLETVAPLAAEGGEWRIGQRV